MSAAHRPVARDAYTVSAAVSSSRCDEISAAPRRQRSMAPEAAMASPSAEHGGARLLFTKLGRVCVCRRGVAIRLGLCDDVAGALLAGV